ncbi:MAG: restriction endonuclease subunit S [Stenotrophobium sp.]
MTAKQKKEMLPRPASLGEGWGEGQAVALEIREGPITPYLTKPQQPRHSHEGGNPETSRWQLRRLRDFARTASGGTPKRDRPQFYGGPILWIKSGELRDGVVREAAESITQLGLDSSSAKIFPKGTLCIALYGATVGRLGILDIEAATNQAVCGIFPSEDVDTKYLFYFLFSRRGALIREAKGGAQPNISQEIIRELQVPVPPLDEQRHIVAELETQLTRLDASVTALKRVQANLKRYRASVLKAACEGRLVSTEAELARCEGRSYESGIELLARLLIKRRETWEAEQRAAFDFLNKRPANDKWKSRYRAPLKPDALPHAELPQSWTVTGVEELSDGIANAIKAGPFGSALKKSFYVENGYKIYGQEQVIRGDAYFGDYFINEERYRDLESCVVRPGDILISLVGTTGKVLILPDDTRPGIINPRLLKLTLNRFGVDPRYIKIVLESPGTRAFFKLAAHGGTMEILNLSILKQLPIALPPFAEQQRIVAEVERRLSVIEELETTVAANLKRAERLRQSVLSRSFAGNNA